MNIWYALQINISTYTDSCFKVIFSFEAGKRLFVIGQNKHISTYTDKSCQTNRFGS
jgi:hypothetical protein